MPKSSAIALAVQVPEAGAEKGDTAPEHGGGAAAAGTVAVAVDDDAAHDGGARDGDVADAERAGDSYDHAAAGTRSDLSAEAEKKHAK